MRAPRTWCPGGRVHRDFCAFANSCAAAVRAGKLPTDRGVRRCMQQPATPVPPAAPDVAAGAPVTVATPGARGVATEVPTFYFSGRRLTYNASGAGLVLFLAVLLPVVTAWTRLLWRRGTLAGAPVAAPAQAPPVHAAALREDSERLRRLEHTLEVMAEEVERIAEGQRYVARLVAEGSRPDPYVTAGAGPPAAVPPADAHRERAS